MLYILRVRSVERRFLSFDASAQRWIDKITLRQHQSGARLKSWSRLLSRARFDAPA
jgi:hypothetical protein